LCMSMARWWSGVIRGLAEPDGTPSEQHRHIRGWCTATFLRHQAGGCRLCVIICTKKFLLFLSFPTLGGGRL
jgi:hypothetical protein